MKIWQVSASVCFSMALSSAAMAMPGGPGCGRGGPGRALLEAMDQNGDGKLTRGEADKAAAERFAKMDKNRDGSVTQEEFRVGRQALHGKAVERRFKKRDQNGDGALTLREADMPASRFDAIDANHDGRVTLAEMRRQRQSKREAATKRGRRGKGRGRGLRGFRHLDESGDGKVTLAEAKQAAAQRFERADANGDGVITADEMRRRGRRGGRGGQGRREAK